MELGRRDKAKKWYEVWDQIDDVSPFRDTAGTPTEQKQLNTNRAYGEYWFKTTTHL
jgi:hypothetical protein